MYEGPFAIDDEDDWELPVYRRKATSSTVPRVYGYISSHYQNEGRPVYENSQPNPTILPNPGIKAAVASNF